MIEGDIEAKAFSDRIQPAKMGLPGIDQPPELVAEQQLKLRERPAHKQQLAQQEAELEVVPQCIVFV
jgi:hypothetical protein